MSDQNTSLLAGDDFVSAILFDMYGHMRNGLSEIHKNIFIKAGYSTCATWWERLSDEERERLINYDEESFPRIYEEMP